MYRAERETYYNRILALYRAYIPNDTVLGRYNGYSVYIDTDNRMMYSMSGQAVLKFRH
jgi:hypothetical protein